MFSGVMEAIQGIPRSDVDLRLEMLRTVQKLFKLDGSSSDIFRREGGFVSLVSMIIALEGAFEDPQRYFGDNSITLEEATDKLILLLQTIFNILAESMHRSEMNKQYFMKDVGYRTVENAIILTGALVQRHIAERVFGILLSFVIESEAVLGIFISVTNDQDNTSGSAENEMYMEKIESMLSQSTVALANPEIIPTILHLQKAASAHKQLCRAVLSALFALSQASRGNQVKLNRSGLLLTLLQRVFPDNETEDVEEVQDREIMLSLMKNLMNMGISSNELRYIFKRFDLNTENNQSSDVLDLILHGASGSRWPGFIQFNDPTTYLEIPQLANFPPPNPGYTLLFWLHIEKQNDVSSLPLFNVWSDQQQIFRVFIDARSKMLLVQSSYSKQPVLFKSFEFHVGFWYHLALVHNKSRLSPRLSSISMYVNGIFIEKVACSYIPQPSVSFPLRATIGYAPGNSLKKQHLIWNLGPTYLIQDTLEKETINLYFSLGPRYRSLYQDSLRQFQTYEATTSLYLTIRNMSKGRRSDSSDQQLLTSILDGSAFQVVPENKIVFAFSAYNTLSEGAYSGLTLTGMSLATRQTIIAENNNSRMIINAAVPKLDMAVYRPNSMGYLIGELIVAYPLGLDESICKIGGCAVALKLIECSQTAQNLCKATAFLFETIRYSWRNSADMERCHGYEILAYILKQKRDIITLELLELLLVFIGKNAQQPENSIINNPLVYRYVVLNFEIWKKTSLEVQKAQLDQFNLFLSTSSFRAFNVKRLQKIHLVKKLLLAFRMSIYSKELVPYVVKALKAVMLSNWDTEGIRAIATFLASTVSQGSMNTAKNNRLRSDSTHSTSSSVTIDEDIPATTDILLDARQAGRFKKSAQMCNIVLEMLHDILCDKSIDPEYINRFASTITNRWPLLFFAPNTNPFTALLAIRVLARLFISQGPSYVGKFKSASDGFLILRKLLPAYWNVAQIHETLILLMMGMDIADYPLQPFSGINGLRRCLQSDRDSKMIIPDVLPIVLTMWDEARKAVGLPKITTFPPILGRPGRKRSDSTATQTMKSNDGKDMTKSTIKQTMDEFVLLVDELYDKRPLFKEVCNKQETQDFFVQVLFLNVCQTNSMLAEDELNAKDAVLANAEIDPATPSSAVSSPVDGSSYFGRSSGADDTASIDSATMSPGRMIKRGGTSALTTKTSPHVSRRTQTFTLRLKSASWSQNNFFQNSRSLQEPMSDPLLDFIVKVCVQSIFNPQDKSQTGLSLVMNAFPPSTHEQQLYFESYLMTHIAQNVKSGLQLDEELLLDQRILNNVAKFGQIAADAAIQSRFRVGGIEQTYDLLASILEILHSDSLYSRYSANDTSIVTIYRSFNRMILAKISDLEYGDNPMKVAAFLDYCIHHQKIILSAKNTDGEFLRCFCYHLYYYLQSTNGQVKDAAANIWKLLLLQKPEDIALLFAVRIKGFECDDLNDGFRQMLEMDLNSFYTWLDSRKVELNVLFNEYVCKSWEQFIVQELKNSREMLKSYVARRINKLRRTQRREGHEREVLSEYTKKSTTWSQEIQEVETNRFMKALQDFEGHENFIHNEWIRISEDLTRERAIWGPEKAMNITWRLDNTEGPNRMRKRLQCVSNVTHQPYLPKLASRSKLSPLSTSVGSSLKKKTAAESKTSPKDSTQQTEKTSADSDHSLIDDELSDSHEDNDEQLFYEEDKSRKVLRLLDQGDMVLDVYNVSQIAGVDACEGLLLLCNNNIYLIDNFFQRSDGEVVEIWDVPKEERDQYLLLIARAAGMETEQLENTTGEHTCRRWSAADLRDVFKRRFLFRDVALEMFFKDGQNALITVALSERDELYSKLVARIESHEESANTIFQGEIENTSSLSSTFRLSSLFGTSTLNDLVQRWERREISNFQYLMYLNAIAGRSYNDITQYPVFPWILADYKSDELDLSNPKTFRDLTKPMGAQTEERRREFEDRYRQWGETGDPTPAFHYGTHYSSAMIVCSFLIRLEPFTQHYLKLQGGTFDHADRLFDSIGKAWDSASEKNMGDVRELIPEFFYLPDFLVNVNKFNFGVKQGSGEAIDSVVLPPWAHGDPKIFIQKHREALESDYVSAHLHHWIDLIFGYKQQGKAAIETLNVFHHVSYEGAVDLDSITDIVEKTATIGIINNFGQTPRQLFKKPHPARGPAVSDPLALGYYVFQEHLEKLVQSVAPLRDIKQQIASIGIYNERLGVTYCQQLLMPSDGSRYIEWGFSDNSLRLYSTETGKLLNVFENMHTGYISSAYFIDSSTLITGGTDSLVCIWKVKNQKNLEFVLSESLKGHTDVVTTIAASRQYSVVVTGSEDKTAVIWDLNTKRYVHSLRGHESGVQHIAINHTTGDIMTCSGNTIRLWTINGDLYLTKSACPSSEFIQSCIFFERKLTEWNSKDLIITGHRNGIIKFWLKQIEMDAKTGQEKWSLALVYQIKHENRFDRALDKSDIVALAPSNSKKTLFTGNRHGQVYAFVLPDTTDNFHFVREEKYKECMTCKKPFTVLERRNHCRTCGGLYCSSCMSNQPLSCPDKSTRVCKFCFERLEPVCNI